MPGYRRLLFAGVAPDIARGPVQAQDHGLRSKEDGVAQSPGIKFYLRVGLPLVLGEKQGKLPVTFRHLGFGYGTRPCRRRN